MLLICYYFWNCAFYNEISNLNVLDTRFRSKKVRIVPIEHELHGPQALLISAEVDLLENEIHSISAVELSGSKAVRSVVKSSRALKQNLLEKAKLISFQTRRD